MQVDAIHGKFRSTADTLKTVLGENGVRGLWRGTPATVVRLSLGAGTHFFLLDLLKPIIETHSSTGTLGLGGAALAGASCYLAHSSVSSIAVWLHCLRCQHAPDVPGIQWQTHAGGLSRGLATVVLSPITLIKTRLEATGALGLDSSRTMVTVAREVIKTQGIRGLWRGCVPAVLSNAPFSAIYYSVYSHCQQAAGPESPVPHTAVNFSAGVLAAMVATLVTQPTDVLRARVQLGVASGLFSAAKSAVKGPDSIPRTFLAGAMPRFLKRTIQTALIWTLYEEITPIIYGALSER